MRCLHVLVTFVQSYQAVTITYHLWPVQSWHTVTFSTHAPTRTAVVAEEVEAVGVVVEEEEEEEATLGAGDEAVEVKEEEEGEEEEAVVVVPVMSMWMARLANRLRSGSIRSGQQRSSEQQSVPQSTNIIEPFILSLSTAALFLAKHSLSLSPSLSLSL